MGNTNSSGHSRRRSRGMSQAEGRSETEAGGAEGSENDADVSGNENSESRHDTGFENEPEQADLASILAFLLRSGQVRLIRDSGSGSVSVNIRSYNNGFSNDTDEDDDDFQSNEDRWRPPSPQAEQHPDTSRLVESQFQCGMEAAGGKSLSGGKNIAQRLCKRETCTLGGMKRSRTHFTLGDKAACSERYLPNHLDVVERLRQKIFCGTYSKDGSVFLSACQGSLVFENILFRTAVNLGHMYNPQPQSYDTHNSDPKTLYPRFLNPERATVVFQGEHNFIYQRIRLYDTSNGQFKKFRDIIARDVGWSIVDTDYSPDQRYLIYSSWSEYIHLCNIYGDYETHVALDLRPGDSRFCAFSICFSPDNREILAGGSDKCIYVYDRESENRILRIDGHDDDVDTVAFADNSSHILFSGADDGMCKISSASHNEMAFRLFTVWDRRTLDEEDPKPVGILAGHSDGITFIDSKGDGRYLLTNSKDQSIKLWDMRKFASEDTVNECRRIVASQNWDYRWENIPRRSRRLKKIAGDPSLMTYRGHSVLHTLLRARFSPAASTGQKYIYAGCATGSVVIYDILTGSVVSKLRGHRQAVRDVCWHPYEPTIMSSSWDFTIGKWQYSRLYCDDFTPEKEEKDPDCTEGCPKRRRGRWHFN